MTKQFNMSLMLFALICACESYNRPNCWSLAEMVRRTKLPFLAELPQFILFPAAENHRDQIEWGRFMSYLKENNRVRTCNFTVYALCDLSNLHFSFLCFLVCLYALNAFHQYIKSINF